MKILGAILAGGAARRFGSDKAEALVAGRPMLEHVAERLAAQTDALVVCGREWRGFAAVPDLPTPGIGPLGGLAGALHHARANGFDLVLSSGCDLPDLPRDLAGQLSPASAVAQGQPLLGLWKADLARELERYLNETDDFSLKAWIRKADVREVKISRAVTNINTPGDLEAFMRKAL